MATARSLYIATGDLTQTRSLLSTNTCLNQLPSVKTVRCVSSLPHPRLKIKLRVRCHHAYRKSSEPLFCRFPAGLPQLRCAGWHTAALAAFLALLRARSERGVVYVWSWIGGCRGGGTSRGSAVPIVAPDYFRATPQTCHLRVMPRKHLPP